MFSKCRALRLVAKTMTWLSLGMWSQCKIEKRLRKRDGPVKIKVNFSSWCGLCTYIVDLEGRCVFFNSSVVLRWFSGEEVVNFGSNGAHGGEYSHKLLLFSGNDYLGLAAHPAVRRAAAKVCFRKTLICRGVCNFYVRSIVASSELMMSFLQSRLYYSKRALKGHFLALHPLPKGYETLN